MGCEALAECRLVGHAQEGPWRTSPATGSPCTDYRARSATHPTDPGVGRLVTSVVYIHGLEWGRWPIGAGATSAMVASALGRRPGRRHRARSCDWIRSGIGRACVPWGLIPRLGGQPPGYLLVGADGGVFSFGSASFEGSMAGQHLAAPVSAVAESVDGNGYWLAGEDKGVFALGNAGFHGSGRDVNYPCFGPPLTASAVPTIGPLDPSPAVGIAPSLDGDGYLVAMADGNVYGYGDAPWDVVGGQVPTTLARPYRGCGYVGRRRRLLAGRG